MDGLMESTTFLGKLTSELGEAFYILRDPMKKAETFGEYVARHIAEQGINQKKVEDRALAEATRRGLEETHTISDARVGQIVNDEFVSLGSNLLVALSWGIRRPIEEVVAVAFGFEQREEAFGKTEFAKLWDLYQQITSADDRSYFGRKIADLAREMDANIANQPVKKSKRAPE